MIFAHLPASYITTTLSRRGWDRGLTAYQSKTVYALGTVAGILPDFDIFFTSLSTHRAAISHTPIFWFACAGLLFVSGVLVARRRSLLNALALALFIGAMTHLLTDAIFVGVKMLYPFSDAYFRMRPPIRLITDDLRLNYILNPIFLTEIHTFLAAWLLLREKQLASYRPTIKEGIRRNKGILTIAIFITAAYCIHWFWLCPVYYCPISI